MIKRNFLFLIIIFFCAPIFSMVFDNRFMPLYLKPYRRKPGYSHLRFQPLFMMANRAQGDFEESSIPDIFGRYDQIQIADAALRSGRIDKNPFRPDLRNLNSIGWIREGKLDAAGLAFYYDQALSCNFSIGTSFLFMHVNSAHEFWLSPDCLGVPLREGDKNYLFSLKEKLNQDLSVTPALFSKTMFGDFDLYLRASYACDYFFKLRSLDLNFKIGLIAPTSTNVSINNPASIPLGHRNWGLYLDIENWYELKEDWYVSWMFRAIKRFKKTFNSRMPVAFEPTNYGAIVGPLEVDPGWTFVFNPNFMIEGIREGLGASVQYTLVAHLRDDLKDKRQDRTIPVNLDPVINRSSWAMENVTVGLFYDTAKFRDNICFMPKISLYWDIPVDWLVSKRSFRTNCVSLMVELDF